jgi:hypothetical protein
MRLAGITDWQYNTHGKVYNSIDKLESVLMMSYPAALLKEIIERDLNVGL